MNEYRPGVSVIIPCYKCNNTIAVLLESIRLQTLHKDKFEVIFVLNGLNDGTRSTIEAFQESAKEIRITIIESLQTGASRARNLGLSAAKFEVVTFVDSDDYIGPKFLECGLENWSANRCVLLPLLEVGTDGKVKQGTISARVGAISGKAKKLNTVPWALGYNAAKFVGIETLGQYRYKESLKSGEDVVFFANLLEHPEMSIYAPTNNSSSSYFRVLRPNSVSRQRRTYNFSVTERLACISELRSLNIPTQGHRALEYLISAQFNFVVEYLRRFPDDYSRAYREAAKLGLTGLEWSRIERPYSPNLVVSYNFPPFADTAANAIGKYLFEKNTEFDLIAGDMSRVRNLDVSTTYLTGPLTRHVVWVNSSASFSDWAAISEFGKRALKAERTFRKGGAVHELVYSRALWSASHVGAALIKLSFPEIFWEAEFSDPLTFSADGTIRPGQFRRNAVAKRFLKRIQGAGDGLWRRNHFAMTELVSLVLADRLVFTNENQKDVVLSQYRNDMAQEFSKKSMIRPHVVPSKDLYSLIPAKQTVADNKINLAYFGNFYANRNLSDLMESISSLDATDSDRICLTIFCSKADATRTALVDRFPRVCLNFHEYLPYLEFLSALNLFDVLIVNDIDTKGTCFNKNPYLPSKYSDYMGSIAAVWGLCEPGSPLSGKKLDYRSWLNEPGSYKSALQQILLDFRRRS